jgi:hypothetical protein
MILFLVGLRESNVMIYGPSCGLPKGVPSMYFKARRAGVLDLDFDPTASGRGRSVSRRRKEIRMAETDLLRDVPVKCPCCGSTIADSATIRRPEIYALLKLPSEAAAFHNWNDVVAATLNACFLAQMELTKCAGSPEILDVLHRANNALKRMSLLMHAMDDYRYVGTLPSYGMVESSANAISGVHEDLNKLFNCTCDIDTSALEGRIFRVNARHYSVFLHAVIRECLRVVGRANQYRFTVRYDVASDAVRAEAVLEAEGEILLEPDYWNVLRIVAALEGASVQVIRDGPVRVRWTFPAQFGEVAT